MGLYHQSDEATPRKPFMVTAVVLAMAIFLLVGRLSYLQLIQGEMFQEISEHNRIRKQDIPPSRGTIHDRNGQLLVDNQPSFSLTLIREDIRDFKGLLGNLAQILALDEATIRDRLKKARKAPPFFPIVIKDDLTREELAKIETYKFENPGLGIAIHPRRYYLYPTLAPHVIGYTGLVTEKQLKSPKLKDMRMGDRVGQSGLEKTFQEQLSGSRGGRQVEVDATGRHLKVMKEIPATPGQNLYLTIDAKLQEEAKKALNVKAGAVVALDPQTGQVLALVSKPDYDQTPFVRGLTNKEWQKLIKNPLHPLENRAVTGQYPPGSTYKMVTALAGLAEGVITPETSYFCPGFYHFGGRDYGCWNKSGHGNVKLHQAIVESCDVYFYRVGQKLGVDRLAKYARMFGLGRKTGLGLRHEKGGLIPTSAWKRRRYNAPWHEGDTLSLAIGQGYNLTTPVQLASAVATMANGGTVWRPYLVQRMESSDGSRVRTFTPQQVGKLQIKKKYLDLVRKAFVGVVNEPRGTGHRAKLTTIKVGGKTGTAQVISKEKFKGAKKIEDIPYKYRDHAWFVAFAPEKNPQIAVAVVAEHSGHGGSAAAPVAGRVIEAFFRLKGIDTTLATRAKEKKEE